MKKSVGIIIGVLFGLNIVLVVFMILLLTGVIEVNTDNKDNKSDEEIMDFYREVAEVLKDKEYRIEYLKTSDIPASIGVIRKERSDEAGNELWFPLMIGYFNESPYAVKYGLSGEEALFDHFKHRQELELEICEKVFKNNHIVLQSKDYTQNEI